MLVLAGLLAAVETELPRFHRDTADSVLADGERGASAARGSAGRIGAAYIIIVVITVVAPHLALPESRKTLSVRLAVSLPITALALLVFLVHVVRRNGFGSTA